jgi:ATP-binding cassette subfamily G (WHITE) protein 2
MFFMILCSFAATSVALAISTLARTTDLAVAILPFVLELARLFGGIYYFVFNF